jgi:hypothetical protein
VSSDRFFNLTTQIGRIYNPDREGLQSWSSEKVELVAAMRAGLVRAGIDPDNPAILTTAIDPNGLRFTTNEQNPVTGVKEEVVYTVGVDGFDIDFSKMWDTSGSADDDPPDYRDKGAEFVRFCKCDSPIGPAKNLWDYYVVDHDLHGVFPGSIGTLISDAVWFFGEDANVLREDLYQPNMDFMRFGPEVPVPSQTPVWAPRGVEGMRRLAGQAGAVTAGSTVDYVTQIGLTPSLQEPRSVVIGWVDPDGNPVTPSAGDKFGGAYGGGAWNAGQDAGADFFWHLISGTALPPLESKHLHPFGLIVPSGASDGLYIEMLPGRVLVAGDVIRAAGNISYHPAERNERDVFSDPLTVVAAT